MDVSLVVAAADDSNMSWRISIVGPLGSGLSDMWQEEGCDGIPTIEAIESIREKAPDSRIHLTIIKPSGEQVKRIIEPGEVGYGDSDVG